MEDDDEPGTHEPPSEPGLAGLSDDDEDYPDDEIPPGEEGKQRAISPVTWEVELHATQDDHNLSVCIILHLIMTRS